MLTYRKKSLKVEIIKPEIRDNYGNKFITKTVAEKLREFIEEGRYSRIADIFFYGDGHNVTCMVVYEESLERTER